MQVPEDWGKAPKDTFDYLVWRDVPKLHADDRDGYEKNEFEREPVEVTWAVHLKQIMADPNKFRLVHISENHAVMKVSLNWKCYMGSHYEPRPLDMEFSNGIFLQFQLLLEPTRKILGPNFPLLVRMVAAAVEGEEDETLLYFSLL